MTRTKHICGSGILNHTPQYAEVDSHHIYPLFLAHLLGVPERNERVDLCSGCHDLIHHVLRHIINEGAWGGHRLSPDSRMFVTRAWDWWQEELSL